MASISREELLEKLQQSLNRIGAATARLDAGSEHLTGRAGGLTNKQTLAHLLSVEEFMPKYIRLSQNRGGRLLFRLIGSLGNSRFGNGIGGNYRRADVELPVAELAARLQEARRKTLAVIAEISSEAFAAPAFCVTENKAVPLGDALYHDLLAHEHEHLDTIEQSLARYNRAGTGTQPEPKKS